MGMEKGFAVHICTPKILCTRLNVFSVSWLQVLFEECTYLDLWFSASFVCLLKSFRWEIRILRVSELNHSCFP